MANTTFAHAQTTQEAAGGKTSVGFFLYDATGAIVSTFGGGGGTQYTEGDTDTSITGTALLWEDTSDTLRPASAAKPLPVSQTGTVTTAEAAPTTVLNGKKTVTTAGTRVTLAGSTACKSVTIKALIANTGTIYVGDSSVASTNGYALLAGEAVSLDIANLSTVNLDASVSGEGVTYLGVN